MKQDRIREAGRRLLEPLISLLELTGVRPSFVTLLGLAVTALAACLVWRGSYVVAGMVLLAGSLLDAVDGALARATKTESAAGAVLDSTSDRLGESLVFLALVAGNASREFPALLYLAPAALIGSFLVSYVRARAEGVGIECKIGLFTRTERLVVLISGLVLMEVFWRGLLVWTMVVLAAGSAFTALRRLRHVHLNASASGRRIDTES